MSTVTELSEPTEAEVGELVDVLTQAATKGIKYGHWTLARWILDAGWRKVPDPPLRYGECRSCAKTQPLAAEGMVVEHDDPREGHGQCLSSRMTPARLVDPPEAVAVDG